LAALAASAQTAGSLVGVTGNVSMVQNGVFTTVGSGATFADGARIVAGANSSVTVQLPGGCNVNLGAGQALIVDSAASCQTMQARVTNISAFSTASAAGTVTGAQVLGLNIAQLASFAFIGTLAYNSISPN